MTEILTADQIAHYRETRLPRSRTPPLRRHPGSDPIRAEIARFEDEARRMTASNDRLDLEDSHTPEEPRLRRIKLPHRISDP